MTTVRRTQSSLSHTSSGVSDKLSPLVRPPPRRPLERDVAAQDAVAQKAEATQVGEARPLLEPGEHRQMQWRTEIGDREVEADAPFEMSSHARSVQPTPRLVTQQRLEPTSVEPDRDDDQVVDDALPLVAVLDRDDDLSLSRLDRRRAPSESAKAAGLVEYRLGLQRDDAAVGALEELAPMRLGQPRPVGRVRVEAVLVVTLSA